jgi:hypothetical protein
MPPAAPAGNAVTDARDQAGAPDTRTPVPVMPGDGARKALSPLPHRVARRAPTASPAACSGITGRARTETRGNRLWRALGLLRRVPKTGASYYDPLFARPDLVEDDYRRLRNQPRSGGPATSWWVRD